MINNNSINERDNNFDRKLMHILVLYTDESDQFKSYDSIDRQEQISGMKLNASLQIQLSGDTDRKTRYMSIL